MNEVEPLHTALMQRKPWLVGIAGIPGAGKTTIAHELTLRIPGSVVVPMDGYHLPRSALTPDQLLRRGAPDTFDSHALRHDLEELRRTRQGVFPTFDHKAKDPQPGAIMVDASATMVIVEGLYLLLREWRLAALFDTTVFLDCDVQLAMDRVAARHLTAGIASTLEEASTRANTIDRRNAELIIADGCRERAAIVPGERGA